MFTIKGHDIRVAIADSPIVVGHTSGLRERTVHAVSAVVHFGSDGLPWRVEITGPYERSGAGMSAVHTTITVAVDEFSRRPAAPQWVLDMIEQVRP